MNKKEIWKDVDGYEGLYKVSNLGRIKSFIGWNGRNFIQREKILNPCRQKGDRNYYRSVVNLTKNGNKKVWKVHQLVAKAFLPNPYNYPVINHKDGNPLNNCVENLEWCTYQHNIKHALENELCIRTINTIDKETLVTMLNNNFSYDKIAEELGIAKGTVFNYIRKFGIKKIYE